MPFYEYRCNACGHEFEAMQKMSDAPLTDCPQCGESRLTKLVSAAGFRLKGGGWYETDFKKGSKKNLHDTGAKDEAKKGGEKQDATKPDSAKKESATAKEKGSGATSAAS
jgi:putative FmdB family regulatory protein